MINITDRQLLLSIDVMCRRVQAGGAASRVERPVHCGAAGAGGEGQAQAGLAAANAREPQTRIGYQISPKQVHAMLQMLHMYGPETTTQVASKYIYSNTGAEYKLYTFKCMIILSIYNI